MASREGMQDRRAREKNSPIKLVLLALGVLVVVGLMADFSRLARKAPQPSFDVGDDLRNLALGMEGERFVHPKGYFSIVKPAGWRMSVLPESHPYDVVFLGPAAADISIMVTEVGYDTLPELVKDIEESERSSGIVTQKDPFFFKGMPAVKRVARLRSTSVMALDFVKNGLAHHVMCGIPPEHFEQYETVLMELLNTYEAGPVKAGQGR